MNINRRTEDAIDVWQKLKGTVCNRNSPRAEFVVMMMAATCVEEMLCRKFCLTRTSIARRLSATLWQTRPSTSKFGYRISRILNYEKSENQDNWQHWSVAVVALCSECSCFESRSGIPIWYGVVTITLRRLWNRLLLEKLTVTYLVKKFPAFYGTRRFIIMFTRARHWFVSWARWIQSTLSHPIL
jgi:hypothetical protein